MFWGLTPALDLLLEYETKVGDLPEEVNILIIGGADCRHVLQTVAKRYRKKNIWLSFYVMDGCVELLAKQLLLLYTALQPQEEMGLLNKTRIFMELYGNTLVRPTTAKYLANAAVELLKMVTDYDYPIMPNVTIDIKYKERDYLENLMKYWCSDDDFEIIRSWDIRLRKYLGLRYDSKTGAFDWDLHMRFHPMGGHQVCSQEYKSFRLNGVAFTWLESEVSKPNRTLACVIVQNGTKMGNYGYLGDMQTGPFVAYGLDSEDKEYLKSTNGQNSFRSTDVTERNLMQIFHEIQYQSNYVHQPITDMKLGLMTLQEYDRVVDFKPVNSTVRRKGTKCIPLENLEIKLASLHLLSIMKCREEYKKKFNCIYFGNTYVKYMDKDLLEHTATKDSLVLVENQKYVVSFRDKQLESFGKSVEEKAREANLRKLNLDAKKDDFFRFVLNPKSET